MDIEIDGISSEQIEKFEQYLSVVSRVYATQGTAAVRDIQAMTKRHFLESAALVPFLADSKSLLDFGAGAGVPGLPLAILRPELKVVVLESEGKKADFCKEVSKACGLSNVTVATNHLDDAALTRLGVFDIVASRGDWELKDYLPKACRFLDRDAGYVMAIKGDRFNDELADVKLPDLRLASPERHDLPTQDPHAPHRIVLVFKHG